MNTHPRRPDQAQQIKRRCHRCHGTGRASCPICGGTGKVLKTTDTLGNPQFGPCSGCFGLKHTRCSVCSGEGYL